MLGSPTWWETARAARAKGAGGGGPRDAVNAAPLNRGGELAELEPGKGGIPGAGSRLLGGGSAVEDDSEEPLPSPERERGGGRRDADNAAPLIRGGELAAEEDDSEEPLPSPELEPALEVLEEGSLSEDDDREARAAHGTAGPTLRPVFSEVAKGRAAYLEAIRE